MDIQWDSPASLMKVTTFATTDAQEELVALGTLRELVGQALALPPAARSGLLLRAAGPDWTQEFDHDALRELAARPEYNGAYGTDDTATLPDDPDRTPADDDATLIGGDISGPTGVDMRGQDGEK